MSYSSPGFWVPLKGRAVPTREHGMSIIEKPKRFGFTEDEVNKILGGKAYNPQDTDKDSGRGRLLVEAMRRGWIRIRSGGGANISVQFYGNPQRAIKKAHRYLEEEAGPFSNITISDLGSGFNTTILFKDLEDAIRDGMFDVAETETAEVAAKDDQTPKETIKVPEGDARRDVHARKAMRDRLERFLPPTVAEHVLSTGLVTETAQDVVSRWSEWQGGKLIKGIGQYQNLIVSDPNVARDIR